MRTIVALICCLATLAVAPAAGAQEARRDPFRPLVSDEPASTGVPGGTDTSEPSTSTGTPEQGSGTTEGTPNTGMPASDWSAIAYMLIALGAAAVVLARLRKPVAAVPRRRRS